jgi:hypothetical protein
VRKGVTGKKALTREAKQPNGHAEGKGRKETNGGSSHKDERHSKVDPVRDESTTGDHRGLNADKESSVVGLGSLGDPGRDGRGVGSVSETADNLRREGKRESENESARLVMLSLGREDNALKRR